MPSDRASASPCRMPLSVCDEVTLTAGKAKPSASARSSICTYCSGVATGMSSVTVLCDRGNDYVQRCDDEASGNPGERTDVQDPFCHHTRAARVPTDSPVGVGPHRYIS